ncbi:hypothetical protein SLEP1_g42853 [Rubroshorea leprosula]|uniref:Uncharacterized protein n=1 Tax=Rubroshorea leprosula TaxID=152421 RepID=A0AAV5LCM4_9ROSI|nr:hypothetical protein SLEP1_g42853 [Rubroshorea leprosula]
MQKKKKPNERVIGYGRLVAIGEDDEIREMIDKDGDEIEVGGLENHPKKNSSPKPPFCFPCGYGRLVTIGEDDEIREMISKDGDEIKVGELERG